VVAVSPASVWRVLRGAGLLSRWKGKPSRKGTYYADRTCAWFAFSLQKGWKTKYDKDLKKALASGKENKKVYFLHKSRHGRIRAGCA